MYNTLIQAKQLAAQLEQPNWRVFDCRFDLMAPQAGREWFAQKHIPSAQYVDLDKDLSIPKTPQSGRHPLPAWEDFTAKLAQWGIGAETQVVLYDQPGGCSATRMWWMLRCLGHQAVAVLDGGLPAWEAAGLPVTDALSAVEPEATWYAPKAPCVSLSLEDIADMVKEKEGVRLLDARSNPRFLGKEEPIDPIAGHIPGARNLPFDQLLDKQGKFLPVDKLREKLEAAVQPLPPAAIVHMCGSGVSACHNILAMEHAGLHGSLLYVGSWSEWIANYPDKIAKN